MQNVRSQPCSDFVLLKLLFMNLSLHQFIPLSSSSLRTFILYIISYLSKCALMLTALTRWDSITKFVDSIIIEPSKDARATEFYISQPLMNRNLRSSLSWIGSFPAASRRQLLEQMLEGLGISLCARLHAPGHQARKHRYFYLTTPSCDYRLWCATWLKRQETTWKARSGI